MNGWMFLTFSFYKDQMWFVYMPLNFFPQGFLSSLSTHNNVRVLWQTEDKLAVNKNKDSDEIPFNLQASAFISLLSAV